MKVGIDTFGLDHGRSGLGSYLLSLVPALPEGGGAEFELFGGEEDRYTYAGERPFAFTGVGVPDSLLAERLWHAFRVNPFGRRRGYGAILYAAGPRMLPVRFSVPGVAVVNDLVSSLLASCDSRWLRLQMRRGLARADCVIAASSFIKKDMERAGISCRRVEVIHSGIDHGRFFPREDAAGDGDIIDIKPFAIKRPYLIYATRMRGREKRHAELVQAFTRFKERTGLPHRLVIAGSEGPGTEEVRKAVQASSAARDILVTGYFPRENFAELYRNAEACVFPSVCEGAGLSVLEAMATGLPVACARAGALPEVAGSNALYFDGDDVDGMAAAIAAVAGDQKLRARLSRGGAEWARRFTWEKAAAATVEVLRSVAAGK